MQMVKVCYENKLVNCFELYLKKEFCFDIYYFEKQYQLLINNVLVFQVNEVEDTIMTKE